MKTIKEASLFTGIGGFDEGFRRAGITTTIQAEIDKYCNYIQRRHFPDAWIIKDVKDVRKSRNSIDLVCGGFPCQDLSVAGKRAGLAGERSGLWSEFARVISELRPRWIVIENVPGLLSSNKGRDMGILTGKLAELGYWWAYRVLDSQYFGVAQRRRRVFIVGHLTEPTYPAKVLFEPESCERHTKPSREAREGNTRNSSNRVAFFGGNRTSGEQQIATAVRKKDRCDFESETFVVQTAHTQANQNNVKKSHLRETLDGTNSQAVYAFDNAQITSKINRSLPSKELSPTIHKGGQAHIFNDTTWTVRGGKEGGGKGYLGQESLPMTLGGQPQWVGVRRLTPLECERLQGFPDGWTEWGLDENGERVEISDTQRYKMLGNAVTVNVAEWIGRRIMELENETP